MAQPEPAALAEAEPWVARSRLAPSTVITALTAIGLGAAIPSGLLSATWPEVVGIVSGFLGAWLGRRENPLAWIAFSVNAAVFSYLFFTIGAYANVAFQIVTLSLCLYGLLFWLRGGRDDAWAPIVPTPAAEAAIAVAFTLGFTLAILWFRRDAPPLTVGLDAVTTALGFVATWLQSRKRLEGWLVNALALAVMIPLFILGQAYVLAIATPAFIAVLLDNDRAWRRSAHARDRTP